MGSEGSLEVSDTYTAHGAAIGEARQRALGPIVATAQTRRHRHARITPKKGAGCPQSWLNELRRLPKGSSSRYFGLVRASHLEGCGQDALDSQGHFQAHSSRIRATAVCVE